MKELCAAVVGCALGVGAAVLYDDAGNAKKQPALTPDLVTFVGVVARHDAERREIDVRLESESLWDTVRFSYDERSIFFDRVFSTGSAEPTTVVYRPLERAALTPGTRLSIARRRDNPFGAVIQNASRLPPEKDDI